MQAGVALARNEISAAERLLKPFLQRHPTDVAAIRMLAEVAGRIGRYEDAENLLRRALELCPSFAAARFNLAIVLDLYLGDTAGALPAMEHYKELAPDDKAVAGWIADLKQRAGKSAAPPTPEKAGG